MSDEHTSWLSALDFYKQELGVIKNRLTEVAGKNTSHAIAGDIEHFENQVKVQFENIDILRHEINDNLSKAAGQAKENIAGYVDSGLLKIHDGQKEQFASLEKVITELRQDFNRFASKWM